MDGYRQEVIEFAEKLTPTTPPKVREEREK